MADAPFLFYAVIMVRHSCIAKNAFFFKKIEAQAQHFDRFCAPSAVYYAYLHALPPKNGKRDRLSGAAGNGCYMIPKERRTTYAHDC